MIVLELLVNALALAAAYGLAALGFVLLLNATAAVNFSQGDLVAMGGIAAAALAGDATVSGIALLPSIVIIMAILGALVGVVAYLPLRRRPPEAVFISTIAVGIILQNGASVVFGAAPRAAPALFGDGDVAIGGLVVGRQSLAIIITASLLFAILYGLFMHTQIGRRLRATAQDRDMAAAIGIPVDAMIVVTFAAAGALAGAAGLLLANRFFVTPTDGMNYVLKAYMATVIGGWGSIPGAIAGAGLIALFEVIYPALPVIAPALARVARVDVLFSQTSAAIVLDAMILLLLFARPQGLFGEAARRRP
jgi:branched-chain amino acid transport system permease protein